MALFKFFNNLKLSVKLNAALVLTFAVLLIAMGITFSTNVRDLTVQITQRRTEQETEVIRTRFKEAEQDLLTVSGLLAKSPGLIQLAADGDANRLQSLILVDAAPLRLDNVKVIDVNRKPLATLQQVETEFESENKLISLGFVGAEVMGVITENKGQTLSIAAVIPLKQGSGTIVGVLIASRKIDQAFLTGINFGRRDVHLSLVSSGQLLARDTVQTASETGTLPAAGLQQALRGQVWIDSNLSYLSDATPRSRAFVPLTVGGDTYAVLMVENELQEIVALQNQLLISTTAIFLLLSLLAVVASVLMIRRNVTAPIGHLKLIAQQMTQGNYRERAKLKTADEIGQLAEAFNTMVDRLEQRVSEAQAARERAEQSDRVKSAFLASMSHELRTPLNAIINFTRFVVRGTMGPVNGEQEEMLNEAIDSAKHLLSLINDVLDIAKIESGSLTLFFENNVNLNTILQTVISTGKTLLAEKSVKLEVDIDENFPLIYADRQRLLQIMLNIVSNACKFTEEGHIKITGHQQGNTILLAVKDTGPGIPAADHAAVFQPFKQTETGLRQGGGTGLGMPISKSLAAAHGGQLWLESAPGQGSTFYFKLPIQPAAPSPELTLVGETTP